MADRIRLEEVMEWKLQSDVDHTREAIIRRARSPAERLNRVADALEADPEYSFNTVGELQGNGVGAGHLVREARVCPRYAPVVPRGPAHAAEEEAR